MRRLANTPGKEKTMGAAAALLDYGYKVTGLSAGGYDIYERRPDVTDAWIDSPDGWLHLRPMDRPLASLSGSADPANGAPWGRPLEKVPGWMQVPWRQDPVNWGTVSGLHPLTHPQCFEWAWPDAEVERVYAHASPRESNPWVRQEDGTLVREDAS